MAGWLYRPWCLFDGDEIVGACFLWLGRPGWALLDYLCVSADHRNRGIGALLLSMLLEQEPDLTIFGESELPSHAPDPVMAEHRLGFYARNGAKTAGYETVLLDLQNLQSIALQWIAVFENQFPFRMNPVNFYHIV